ncbi:MAG: TIGR02444 family protein [Phenylobacterium sp.]|uniref:TIGR02444 family protein n=1 Tax=Phenylobacterium sp. TaxID=1871053 RepID=UPI00391DFAA8
MAIWDWALAVYARPGVPEACLKLQDLHGQNTSLLLWAAYAGAQDEAILARACAIARTWDQTALLPLRAVRRGLKPPLPPVDDRAREGLRDDVKAAELRAERVLLETLELLGTGGADAVSALRAASAAWGPRAPDAALVELARALG